jgi:hypothetical protein
MSPVETLAKTEQPAIDKPMGIEPSRPRMKTEAAELLSVWQYAEYSAMRVLTGWGREAGHWDDKLAMCYHSWLQAENVDKLRERLKMFPGNPDAPVAVEYEHALNVLFLAPSWADAMLGLHEILHPLLVQAYNSYIENSHPVHDAPTHKILREIIATKVEQRLWFDEFQRRENYTADNVYVDRVRQALVEIRGFSKPLAAKAPFAKLAGKNTGFRMKAAPGKVPGGSIAPNFFPLF